MIPTTPEQSPAGQNPAGGLGTWFGVVLGVLATLWGLAALAAFFSRSHNDLVVRFASFVPIWALVPLVSAVVLAFTRFRLWAVVPLVVALTVGGLFLPLYRASPVTPEGRAGQPLTLMQANILMGQGDLAALAAQARESGADILTLQELSVSAIAGLRDVGIDEIFPYQYLQSWDDTAIGSGIYSRLPLRDTSLIEGTNMANLRATVALPEGDSVTVFSVHPVPPYPHPATVWAGEVEILRAAFAAAVAEGPVLVGGDFNATYAHRGFRDVLGDGLASAAEVAGAGLIPTYPAGRRFPAVIGIDHILVHSATVQDFRRAAATGADHYPVIATVTPYF